MKDHLRSDHAKHSQIELPLLLIVFLVGILQVANTIYTPAFVTIVEDLNTVAPLVQWTITSFMVGVAWGILFWGNISDYIGRRPAILWGLVVASVGTIGCGLSWSVTALMLFRALQGFGIGVGTILTQTMVRDAYVGKRRNKVFAVLGIGYGLFPSVGPLLGGFISQYAQWRSCFVFILLAVIALFIFSYFFLPETHPEHNRDPHRPGLGKVFSVLVTDRVVLGFVLMVSGSLAIFFSFYAEAPFIFVELFGISKSLYGVLALIPGLSYGAGSMISRRMNERHPGNRLMLMGIITVLLGSLLLSTFALLSTPEQSVALSVVQVLGPSVFIGLGIGIAMPNALSLALIRYTRVMGTAGAIFGLFYTIIAACGIGLMGVLHNGTIIPMPLYLTALSILLLVVFFTTIYPSEHHEEH